MSKLIYACLRDGSPARLAKLEGQIGVGGSRIKPDGSGARPTSVIRKDRVIIGISNPSNSIRSTNTSVCLGHVADAENWSVVGGGSPEGTYAICRSNGTVVELLADAVASRTLWYYFDDAIFVASTSQRWIATVLSTFDYNLSAATWMLTAGTLGPVDGWDRRVERLQADSTLILNMESWTTSLDSRVAEFKLANDALGDHPEQFRQMLQRTFAPLQFSHSEWVLPLSGGYDSRAILCLLENGRKLRSITWGTPESKHDPNSDAAIATRLAAALGVSHEYFEINAATGSLSDVFDRFVECGEGRTDHISGYLDGFAIWKTLMSRGVEGILRGDEGFGWKAVRSFNEARVSVGLRLWSDFVNLSVLGNFGLPEQEIPQFLLQKEEETVSGWRDRLYHQYRIPTLLAALTDLKAAYVEIANPLLTHTIIHSVRTLPDDLRTDKKLFKQIVSELSPAIPYADIISIADRRQVMRTAEAEVILTGALESETARALFPAQLLLHIHQGMSSEGEAKPKPNRSATRRWLRKVVPQNVKQAARRGQQSLTMDFHAMAFRVYIICRTHDLMTADALAGKRA